MAKRVSEVVTCDMCGEQGPTENVTIVFRGHTTVLDVCPKCIAQIETLVTHGSTEPRRRDYHDRSRTPAHAVIPID